MIVTHDRDLLDGVVSCACMESDRDAFDRYTSETPGWFYRVVAPGFK